MQKHSYYLVKYLARQQVHVDLFHYNHSSLNIHLLELFTEVEKKYITAYVLSFPSSFKFPGHYIYRSYKYSEKIFDLVKGKLHTYDFIYTKGFSGWKLISEKYKKRVNCCNIGVKFHGYEMYQVAPDLKTKLQHLLLRTFVKKISRRADRVFSYGGKITGIIRGIGVDKRHIIEIPSGVETRYISANPSENHIPVRFIFVGRYERRKGIEELHKVLISLIVKGRPVLMSFIGPVPEDKKIRHETITYYGEIRDAEQINSILRTQDVLVCPSWSEGFPNVILEAMAAGLAVIATDVGAVSSMVDAENGILIEPGDLDVLEKAILACQNHPDLNRLKTASLSKVSTIFNWDHIIKAFLSLIRES